MAVDILLGLQWGDEGKGKIVDYLTPKYDIVARFQGGPNAGHTLEFEGIKHVLHQIPSGIFWQDKVNVIGNGVVLDPVVFKKEIEGLDLYKLDTRKNLLISKRAQLILPTHKLLDKALETAKGDNKIGSTLKGIGPAYQDKIGRQGLRVGDIAASDFSKRYLNLKNIHLKQLSHFPGSWSDDINDEQFLDCVEFMKGFQLIESEYYLNKALRSGKRILAEGAQGSLLDIDFGTYPFVTSSNTISAGACTGLGIPPGSIGEVFGIFKAYSTRVGSGPFPTELNDETGELMRKKGNEFGSTTGRPRRCGWLDIPALKYSIQINGVTQLFMMKADVLSGFSELKLCTGYKLSSGEILDYLPYESDFSALAPDYKLVKGWSAKIDDVFSSEQLPVELNDYMHQLESILDTPIKLVSIGPDRKQTIIRESKSVIS